MYNGENILPNRASRVIKLQQSTWLPDEFNIGQLFLLAHAPVLEDL